MKPAKIKCPGCEHEFALPELQGPVKAITVVCPSCGTYADVKPRTRLGFEISPEVVLRERSQKKE